MNENKHAKDNIDFETLIQNIAKIATFAGKAIVEISEKVIASPEWETIEFFLKETDPYKKDLIINAFFIKGYANRNFMELKEVISEGAETEESIIDLKDLTYTQADYELQNFLYHTETQTKNSNHLKLHICQLIWSIGLEMQKLITKNKLRDAYEKLSTSFYWLGILDALNNMVGDFRSYFRQELSKLGVDARHKENREMKSDVFNWLEKNRSKYSSINATAEAIVHVEKVVPLKVSTARNWVSEWEKMNKLTHK